MSQITRRPNILFLMSDEHRADVAGFAGNAVVRTPVLDELARTGVVFCNAYTPSPICIPARQCIMAGQFPRTCGVERFGHDLPPGSMTFARRLAQFAYATVCCGKLHHCGTDQMQGWTSRPAGDCHVTPEFLTGRDDASFQRDVPNVSDHKWSDAKEIIRAGVGRGRGTQDADRRALDAALHVIEHYFVDTYYDRATPERPLLLKVSFARPHYPYLTNEERFRYYLNRVEPYIEHEVFDHPFLSQRQVTPGKDVTERDLRRATAAYYGMIEEIDHDYGRLLDALREAGQDPEDWWVIYTSDHGEMLGEHGIWEKQKFFEASVRVPLIIRPPRALRQAWGCEGRCVTQNVNLCDLFATLCDAADVPLPEEGTRLDSRSLVPLMRDDAVDWNDESISQFGGKNLMIKRGTLKYQRYNRTDCAAPEHAEVLFDLDADPAERRNLAGEAKYREAVTAFRRRAVELGFADERH